MGLFWALQPAPGGREGLRQVMISSETRAKRNYLLSDFETTNVDRETGTSENKKMYVNVHELENIFFQN